MPLNRGGKGAMGSAMTLLFLVPGTAIVICLFCCLFLTSFGGTTYFLVMSDSKGKVLCQEANCAAAYPLPEIGNAAWGGSFIDGSGRIMPRLIQNSNIFVNAG